MHKKNICVREVKIIASLFLLCSRRALKVIRFQVLSHWYLPVDSGVQKVKWRWLCSSPWFALTFSPRKTLQTLHFRKQMIVQNEQRKTLDFSPTVPGSAISHTNSKPLTSHSGNVATEELYRIILQLQPSVRSCFLALWWTSVLSFLLELICKVFSIVRREETRWTLGYFQEFDCIVQRRFWWLHF